MRVSEIHVGRYGPLARRTVEVEPGVHVLYGPNEAGKTLFLEATLRLVEPDITGVMSSLGRIEEAPHGYVRVTVGGEDVQVDGDESLFADTDVDPAHLANIFVVRESALTLLSDEHSFYSSLTEHIGELHTSALDRIEDELLQRGRLTRRRRGLSSAEGRDDAEGVRERADSLREDVETYVAEAESEGLDDLEGELVAARARLDRLEDEVAALDRAESLRRHRRLEERLEEYRSASEELEDLAALTSDSLRDLHRRRDAIGGERERIASWRKEIEEHERRIAALDDRIEEKKDELAPLRDREADVEQIEARLDELPEREAGGDLGDAERVALRTGVGLVGAGAVLQAVSLVLGAGLDTVALLAGGLGGAGLASYGWLRYRRLRAESERRALARAAAGAGLEAEEPREIAAEIRTFRSRLQGVGERIEALREEADGHRTRVDTFESQVRESREKIEEHEEAIEELLDDGGVDSVAEYEECLERKEELERARSAARQSLAEALGQRDAEEWRDARAAWKDELRGIADGVDEEAAADEYDPSAHEGKRETLGELEEDTRELSDRLDEHRDRIDRYERRLRDDVDAEPFLGSRIELEARTTEGLRRLAGALGELVDRIERDAEVSKLALDVVDELRVEEERKITDLFAPDGPAAETFRRISDDRYRGVRYDPDDRTLVVSDAADGRELVPEQLSKGARDQLYLAARVGLANRLLGGDRGFFVLDDPLVAADRERLTAAFRVLQSLADEGWQILYFTAKDEVREAMVDEFGLPLTTFDGRL